MKLIKLCLPRQYPNWTYNAKNSHNSWHIDVEASVMICYTLSEVTDIVMNGQILPFPYWGTEGLPLFYRQSLNAISIQSQCP